MRVPLEAAGQPVLRSMTRCVISTLDGWLLTILLVFSFGFADSVGIEMVQGKTALFNDQPFQKTPTAPANKFVAGYNLAFEDIYSYTPVVGSPIGSAGNSAAGFGTLGCFLQVVSPGFEKPVFLGLTCSHVIAPGSYIPSHTKSS